MSKVSKNPLLFILKRQKQSERLQAAREKLREKSFTEQYVSIEGTIRYARLLFHFFSILTAYTFLYLLLDSFLHNTVVSVCISLLLLVLWEYTKSILLQDSFYSYYRNKSIAPVSIIALIMLGASIYTSLQGAKIYYEQNTSLVSDFKADTEQKADSINSHYYTKIEAVKEELKAFKEEVSWRGKINVYNPIVQAEISRFNALLSTLEEERLNSIAALKEDARTGLNEATEQAEFNLIGFIVLASINEILILVCCWFMVYFNYNLVKESEAVQGVGEEYTFNADSLNRYTQHILLNAPMAALNEQESISHRTKSTIGFNFNNHSVNQAYSSKEQEKEALSTDQKIKGLVSDIKSGITDYRTLMQRNSVNVNTVKKYLTELL